MVIYFGVGVGRHYSTHYRGFLWKALVNTGTVKCIELSTMCKAPWLGLTAQVTSLGLSLLICRVIIENGLFLHPPPYCKSRLPLSICGGNLGPFQDFPNMCAYAHTYIFYHSKIYSALHIQEY
jgi:hypothetical protein